MASKKECENAVDCFAFRMVATAVLTVGSHGTAFAGFGKTPLEVIPLKKPNAVKTGDAIPVKVTLMGKPVTGAKVQAVDGNDKGAAHSHEGQGHGHRQHWAQEGKTDEHGVSEIKLTCGGPWLIMVNHEVPYEDTSECDRYSYRTSLTCGF